VLLREVAYILATGGSTLALATLGLAILLGAIAWHALESRAWAARGRPAVLRRSGADPAGVMRSKGLRWAWWWGWRGACGEAGGAKLRGLADSVANIALGLAVSQVIPILPCLVLVLGAPGRSSSAADGLLDGAGYLSVGALPLALVGIMLSRIWPSRPAMIKCVIALVLSAVPVLFPPLGR
jgi:hypothetical protein